MAQSSSWLLPQKCWLRMRVCSLSLSARLVKEKPHPHLKGSPADSSLPLLLETTILSSQKRRKNASCSLWTHFHPCYEKICYFHVLLKAFPSAVLFLFLYSSLGLAWNKSDDARPFSSAFASQSVVPQMFIVSEWKRINSSILLSCEKNIRQQPIIADKSLVERKICVKRCGDSGKFPLIQLFASKHERGAKKPEIIRQLLETMATCRLGFTIQTFLCRNYDLSRGKADESINKAFVLEKAGRHERLHAQHYRQVLSFHSFVVACWFRRASGHSKMSSRSLKRARACSRGFHVVKEDKKKSCK